MKELNRRYLSANIKRADQPSSLARWIKAYLQSGPKEVRSIWQYLRDKDPYLFAHHPAAPCFRAHVWQVGGFYWCKGCLMSTAGGLLGLALQLGLGWQDNLSDFQMGICLILMLCPTFASAAFPLPFWLKHSCRFLLGIATASAFLQLFITDSWLIRVIILLSFIAIRQPLSRYRERLNQTLSESAH